MALIPQRACVLILAGASIFSWGCSKSDGGGFPESLDQKLKEQIRMERPGASAEAASIVVASLKASRAEIPSRDLFTDRNTSSERRERLFARLSEAGRSVAEAVGARCTFVPTNSQVSGDLREGGKVASVTSASVSGHGCPLEQSFRAEVGLTLESIERTAGTFTGRGEISIVVREKALERSIVERATLQGFELQAQGPVRVQNVSASPASGSEHSRYAGVGELILASGQKAPIEFSAEHLRREARVDRQMILTLKHPAGAVVIGVIEENGSRAAYLNGRRDEDGSLESILGLE